MRDLAPDISRQRLLIEGYYAISVDREAAAGFLTGVAQHLHLKTYGQPTIHSPTGTGRRENQGFDAFIRLIDSGSTMYVWSELPLTRPNGPIGMDSRRSLAPW